MSSAASTSSSSGRWYTCTWATRSDWLILSAVLLLNIFLIASAAPASTWTTVLLKAQENSNNQLEIRYVFTLSDASVYTGATSNSKPIVYSLFELDNKNGNESNCVSAAKNTSNLTIVVLVIHLVFAGLYLWKRGAVVEESSFQICDTNWFKEILANRIKLLISGLFFFALILQISAVGSFNNSKCLSLIQTSQNNTLNYSSSQIGGAGTVLSALVIVGDIILWITLFMGTYIKGKIRPVESK